MRLRVVPFLLLLSACGEGPDVSSYRDPRDRVEATIGFPLFGRGPCFRALRDLTFEVDKSMAEICYKLTKPERWRGLWRNDFEGSRFCAAPAKRCAHDTPGAIIWIDHPFGLTQNAWKSKVPPGGLYEIEFIGRRTAVKGHYGHMGMSEHQMVVDRLISIKQVEAPPAEPTKEQIIARFKKCEAAKSCIPNWQFINSMEK